MRKQKINVIDLDKTLVSFDTFRKLVIREIKKRNFTVIVLTVLRISRLVSSSNYKMWVQKYLKKNYSKSFFKDYADEIYQKINPKVMEIIYKNTDDGTLNILLSASPNEYVEPLYELLNWKGSGSYFDEGNKFHHLFENEKINWLKEFFPIENYFYHFAISDSKTDWPLLELFDSKIYFEGD